jgi:EmrB/QacA subfamily drug resistance transporter
MDQRRETVHEPVQPGPPPAVHTREVMAVLITACVSFSLAQTVVIPAIPAIAAEVGASTAATSWLLTGFLLSASVSTPIVGKLGDVHGRGRVLAVVLLIFTAGGVVNAFADSLGVLVAGRVLQGVAGGVFPLAFGIVRDTFPRERVPHALGIVSAVFGIGGGIGLPLSGVILDHGDVSMIFWVNLVALPAAVAAWRVIPRGPVAASARIDWLGAGLLSVALTALLLGVSQSGSWGWGSARTIGLLVAGVAVLGVWVVTESRVREPLISMAVLRRPVVAATNLAGLLVGVSMFASFLAIPQFAQAPESAGYGFGASVTAAGLLLVPVAAAQLLTGAFVGRLEGRFGSRVVLAAGTGLAAVAFAGMAVAHAHPWHFVVLGALFGAGLTLSLASMANLVVGAVDQSEVGIASGINTVTRTVGGSFGAAVASAILSTHTIPGSPLPTEGAYAATFAFSAAAALLALVATLLIPRPGSPRAAHVPDEAVEPAAA